MTWSAYRRTGPDRDELTWYQPPAWYPIPAGARACCCPAQPVVQAVLPPTLDRPAVELLLCRQHNLASRRRLIAAGAVKYDRRGRLRSMAGAGEAEPPAGAPPARWQLPVYSNVDGMWL